MKTGCIFREGTGCVNDGLDPGRHFYMGMKLPREFGRSSADKKVRPVDEKRFAGWIKMYTVFDVNGKVVASAELPKTAQCQSLECNKLTGSNPHSYPTYGSIQRPPIPGTPGMSSKRTDRVRYECRRDRHSVPTLGEWL